MRPQNDSWQAEGEYLYSDLSMYCMLFSTTTLSLGPAFSVWSPLFVLLTPFQTMEGLATTLSSVNNMVKADKNTYTAWKKYQDAGDFATGLALFSTGTYAIKQVCLNLSAVTDTGLAYDVVNIVAIGQAIKSAHNFIKAAANYSSSQKTGKKLNEQRREVLFHGLKFIGYTLISCGFLPAGAAFLGTALAVSLYNNSPQVQKYCSSIATLFTPKSPLHASNDNASSNHQMDGSVKQSP